MGMQRRLPVFRIKAEVSERARGSASAKGGAARMPRRIAQAIGPVGLRPCQRRSTDCASSCANRKAALHICLQGVLESAPRSGAAVAGRDDDVDLVALPLVAYFRVLLPQLVKRIARQGAAVPLVDTLDRSHLTHPTFVFILTVRHVRPIFPRRRRSALRRLPVLQASFHVLPAQAQPQATGQAEEQTGDHSQAHFYAAAARKKCP
mmetsp:Transcript_55377/g.159216  ORF Transcript_55377/g.159216 Transcript_55377/m.159216 type:complete len:206 (-) Transcript_55377:162-779(-)